MRRTVNRGASYGRSSLLFFYFSLSLSCTEAYVRLSRASRSPIGSFEWTADLHNFEHLNSDVNHTKSNDCNERNLKPRVDAERGLYWVAWRSAFGLAVWDPNVWFKTAAHNEIRWRRTQFIRHFCALWFANFRSFLGVSHVWLKHFVSNVGVCCRFGCRFRQASPSCATLHYLWLTSW